MFLKKTINFFGMKSMIFYLFFTLFFTHAFSEVEDEPWERKLAKRYYEKLFKEYCLADLSRYRENMLALRWRTEQEVLEGKGQHRSWCRRSACRAVCVRESTL